MVSAAEAAAQANVVAHALHEMHAPTTAPSRRAELQALLHKERELAAADATHRGVWRQVLATAGADELVLWFALSTCESSLRETVVSRVPAAERLELKQVLTAMLHGPCSAQLPPSARTKGIVVLAQLARAAWPTEEPALLHEVLSLLHESGASRALGARLLTAIAEEFAASDARRPATGRATGTAGQQQQAQRQAALIAFLPAAYRALGQALQAELTQMSAATYCDEGAALCLEAGHRLLSFGRVRSGTETCNRAFTAEEVTTLPELLAAACKHLVPSSRRHKAAVASLSLLAELCELQDPRVTALFPPLVEPLVHAARCLADEAALPPGYPRRCPYDLDEDCLDELENALCYALDAACRTWLLRVASAAAAPLLTALWAHSRVASAEQLRRFVGICNTLLEMASNLDGGGGAALHGLADGLISVAPELISRLLLSQSSIAAREFELEVEERWASTGTTGGASALSEMWAVDGLGGCIASASASSNAQDPEDEEGDQGGLQGLLAETGSLFFRLAALKPVDAVNLLAASLSGLLPSFAAARTAKNPPLAVCYDVATIAKLLASVLAVASASVDDPLTKLPLSSVVQLLLDQLGAEAPPPSPSPYVCRAELALLSPLLQCCRLMSDRAVSNQGTDAKHAVEAALASSVAALIARGTSILAGSVGGGVAAVGASGVLLELAGSCRWPPVVHEAGALRHLASLGAGSLSSHAATAGVPMNCWPRLFAAVVLAMIVPPRGARAADYAAGHLPPPRQQALHTLVESLVTPLRNPSGSGAAGGGAAGGGAAGGGAAASPLDLAIGAPTSCLCAIVVAARDAPQEARAAVDDALRSSLLHEALQTQLASLPLVSPPPLGAICSLLRLLRALTRSVGASGVWASQAAAQWALNAALQSIRLAASAATVSSKAAREGLLEAALELVLTAASERRAANCSGSAELVTQILDACGPQALGALLVPAGSTGLVTTAHSGAAPSSADEASLLSPPLREQFLGLGHALLRSHWRYLSGSAVSLGAVMHLLAAGLMHPADQPAFRKCLPAVILLHERLFARTGGGIGAAILAAGLHGGGNGVARPFGSAAGVALADKPPPSMETLELACQLRCLVLSARIDASNTPVHDEAADCVYTMLQLEARAADDGSGGDGAMGAAVAQCAHALVERCLGMQTWLSKELSATLISDFRSSNLSDQLNFKSALARLADDLSSMRAEAAHAERGADGF